MKTNISSFTILFTTIVQGSWAAISCFTCPDRVAYPRDCPFVSVCGQNEVCYVDQFVTQDGHTFYRSGCRSKTTCGLSGKREIPVERRQVGVGGEIKTCEECCTSDHCNYGGCGEPPPPRRGPICYNCFQQQREEDCNRVTICPENCECHIMRSPDSLDTSDLVYTTGCVRKSTCHPGQQSTSAPPAIVVGRRESDHNLHNRDVENDHSLYNRDIGNRGGFCFTCCPNDLCNRNCSHAHSHAASTTPQPVMTSSVSTSVSTSTSTTTTSSTTTPPSSTTTSTTTTKPTPTTTTSTTTLPSTTTTSTTTTPTTSTTSTTKAPPKCPADFQQYLNHCYYFSTDIKYWGEALQICKLKGAYLAKIEDQLEENFIQSVIQPLMSNNQIPKDVWGYYIGAHLVQGKWQWSDGIALNYTNWGNNEPDHPGEQNFGFIFLPGHYAGDYKWGSHSDMQGTSRYICEKDLI